MNIGKELRTILIDPIEADPAQEPEETLPEEPGEPADGDPTVATMA